MGHMNFPRSPVGTVARPLLVAALTTVGCALPRPDAKLPSESKAFVAVLSGQMPMPIDEVSRHAWIVTHHSQSQRYQRFEMGGDSERDPYKDFAAGDVMLHGVVELSDEELTKTEKCLSRAGSDYYTDHRDYFPIPGPNSNTFVAYLLRHCGLHVELPSTAIGRDYVGPVGAQVTEAGTGVQVGSIPFGVRLGLKEGVEFQLFGLPFGVHFWPPGITVPVNPGRIGFATDGHEKRSCECHMDDEPTPANQGVGTVTMLARGGGALRPSRAGGLLGLGTVGMSARALYGMHVGYGVGLDFDAGFAAPFGFAGSLHLFPVGVGYMIGPTGYIGLFSGIGTSGVSSAVPAGLDLPQEARLELDVGRRARLSLVAQGIFVATRAARQQGRLWFDETLFGAYARFGALKAHDRFSFASGSFFGLERRELMGSPFLGIVFGTQIDAGMSDERQREHRGTPYDE